jgi:hypothetical protein
VSGGRLPDHEAFVVHPASATHPRRFSRAVTFKVPEWANKFECLVSVALVAYTRTSTRRGQNTAHVKTLMVSTTS